MRVLNKPKVYLICRPQIVESGLQEFLKDLDLRWPTPTEGVMACETLVEVAGRCCYMSFGSKAGSKTNAAYIDNLLGRLPDGGFRDGPAHGAVTEHPCWSFIVVGAGRGFSHEQVRNRAGWAYSQLSTRYCDFEREESEPGDWEPGFCVPPLAQLSQSTAAVFEERMKQTQTFYVEVLNMVMADLKANLLFMETLSKLPEKEQNRALRKAARGAARDLLINATEAIMVMSCNARGLWNTMYLRASEHAEAVIRDVWVQIARIMIVEMPSLFKGLKFAPVWDGTEQVIMPRGHI